MESMVRKNMHFAAEDIYCCNVMIVMICSK